MVTIHWLTIGTGLPVPTSLTATHQGRCGSLDRHYPLSVCLPVSLSLSLSARLGGLGRYNHKVHGRPFILRCPNSPCQTRTRREIRIDLSEARAHPSPQNVPSCAAGVVLKSAQPICLEFKKARGSRPPRRKQAPNISSPPRPFPTPSYSFISGTHPRPPGVCSHLGTLPSDPVSLVLLPLSLPPPASGPVRACQATVPG